MSYEKLETAARYSRILADLSAHDRTKLAHHVGVHIVQLISDRQADSLTRKPTEKQHKKQKGPVINMGVAKSNHAVSNHR